MKKSRLNIVQKNNIITIKKRADGGQCGIFIFVLLGCVLLPILFDWSKNKELFWAIWAICAMTNIAVFISIFCGKIVIDLGKKEISIYNLCKETYRFDEIKEVKCFYKEGDPDGGRDISKVMILLANGRRSEFETASKVQTEELSEYLNRILLS